jgi:phosphoribosylglycinamide formyltransferase-1
MFEAVVEALETGRLNGTELAFVFCNRDPGEHPVTDDFFARVRELHVPLVTRSSVAFRKAVGGERSRPSAPLPAWRLDYDRAVEAALAPYPFDLGVLAGYMLIFEREFSRRHALLNLHPALPDGPAGTWREVIRHLVRTRAEESGVMLHLAIPEVDAGPVVAYCRYSLRGPAFDQSWAAVVESIDSLSDADLDRTALFGAIRTAGVRRESPLLVATLSEFAAGRLRAEGGTILDVTGDPASPADLTTEVDAMIDATPARP